MVLRHALGWVARLWIRHHMLLLTFINVNALVVGLVMLLLAYLLVLGEIALL